MALKIYHKREAEYSGVWILSANIFFPFLLLEFKVTHSHAALNYLKVQHDIRLIIHTAPTQQMQRMILCEISTKYLLTSRKYV